MHFTFESIGMEFQNKTPILKDIDLDIAPGTRLALIGQSGAGKSTIASLLRRDRDPTSGRILLDGEDLRSYNHTSVLKHIGVILQQPEILTGTVRENILFAIDKKGVVSDDEIWSIIDLVRPGLRDRFYNGLDTRVGVQGMQLSGGEKQSLCVMRALIKRPAFLIVDEATSSLDSETEIEVQHGIDIALQRGIGAIVIAHRFATLQRCSKFVTLKRLSDCTCGESQIEAVCDSFDELYAESPLFKDLADAQGFRPRGQ